MKSITFLHFLHYGPASLKPKSIEPLGHLCCYWANLRGISLGYSSSSSFFSSMEYVVVLVVLVCSSFLVTISSTSSASRVGRTSRGSQCISYLISFFRLPGSADIAQNGVPWMPSRVLAGRDPQRDRLDQNQQCATRTMG